MTSITNNILVVGCTEGCSSLVQEAFPYVHVEQLGSVKSALLRMKKDPPVHALLLNFKAFDPRQSLDVLRSFQQIFPEVPIIVINHKNQDGEHDSELIIQHGAQDVINMPTTADSIRSTIIRSMARHSVRREFEPIEKEIGDIKSDVTSHCKDFITKCESCSLVTKSIVVARG